MKRKEEGAMFFSDLVWFLIGEKTNLDIQKRSFLKISSSFTISKSLPFKIIFSTRPKRWQVCPKDDVNSRITWKYFRYSRLKGSILLRQFRVFRGALYSKKASSIQMSPVFCARSKGKKVAFYFGMRLGKQVFTGNTS